MLKSIRHFFKEYRELGFVIISIIVGGLLDITKHHTAAHWVLAISASIAVIPLLWGMWQDIRTGKYGIDILAATAIIASVALHEYWAAIVICLMLTGGEALEDYAERRAHRELDSLMKRSPTKAHRLNGRKTTDVAVSKVAVGDKLMILPGEVVPVDAIIIEGESSFDESSLTGESLPVIKKAGDTILSGSINLEGAITVKVLHTAHDSQYQQIIQLVKAASTTHSPFVRLADRYSIPFTVTAFIIAGAAWFISGEALRFLEVIVVATPCPLLLGAPIALISGMSRAAREGIIVKTGSAMEKLASIRTMAFDKTGTLTRGVPVVSEVIAYTPHTKDEVLSLAAALEQNSNHVLARTIVDAAIKKNIKLPSAKHVQEISGRGLQARVGGKSVLIGRLSLLVEENISLVKGFTVDKFKETASFVAVDGKLAGVLTFTDEVRPETENMLKRLRKLGIKHTLMVTGDNATTANVIAKKLGIEQVEADCLPSDKMQAIEAIKQRPVGFVGDGVNDAPVLTAADVGIALGARGSTAASESADVVILLDDVSKVADSVEIASRTFFIAKQSILIGIFISLGLMAIFSTGRFKPVYGAAIQELVDVTVIINALRAHGPRRNVK